MGWLALRGRLEQRDEKRGGIERGMEEMRGDGGKHEEDGKHDEKKIDGRHLMEGIKWRRCERERRMMMGNEMHWRLKRIDEKMRDGGKTKGKMKNRKSEWERGAR